MRISVITVSYNSAATIVDTVESVLGQTGVNLEYIVMDGGSTDDMLEKLGKFRTELRIAADYEFMLRVLHKHQCPVSYLPEVLVKMRTGGASNRSALNVRKANRECYRAWRMNGYGGVAAGWAIARKPFSKLRQLRRAGS